MTDPAPASASQSEPLAPEQLPRHVAVIMYGNGRWAQQQGLPRIEGHRRGVTSVRKCVEECARIGIGQLTLYCLSSENWKRPQLELDFLMHLLEQYLVEERTEILSQNIRLSTIGRRSGIPDRVIAEMDKTIELSRDNTGMRLCLAINYAGRGEIVDAVRLLVADVQAGTLLPEDIDEHAISDRLYTADMVDPDLIIRTAGELRVSNFLLWQMSYSEIWVTDRCWPEFREPDLEAALRGFAARDRRYGGLSK